MPQASRVPAGAVAQQLPGVSVCFHSKPPHTRFDIVVSSPAGQPANDDLANALLAIGFNKSRELSPSDGLLNRSFEREGSGLCGGWSAAERDKLTRDARFALRRFGFTMVPEVRS
ncbi:MAG: hypothetical protein ACR2IK_19960 [Chloroflexota bacterium]